MSKITSKKKTTSKLNGQVGSLDVLIHRNNIALKAAHKRKRTYERTTPVGRILKHLGKAQRIASFAVERMQAWEHSTDPDLIGGLAQARNAVAGLDASINHVTRLFSAKWTPPKKSTVVTYAEGEDVRIVEKYKEKYLQIYPPATIDNLVVAKCLPTGEIAVRHGGQSPFIVAKSHIEKRRSKPSAASETSPSHPK
jgi:hypothetical protein